MTSANLELVRSICAQWECGDYSAVDWQGPGMEFVIADGPTPGAWTGSTGIAEGWGAFLSAWEGFYTEVDEYREVDDERVVVFTRWGGRGKASGLPAEAFGAQAAGLFSSATARSDGWSSTSTATAR